MKPSKTRANELNDMFCSGHLQHEHKRLDMKRKYVNSYKAQRKEPELTTYFEVGLWVVAQIYKACKLAFSDINRNRRLGLRSRSPYVGVATRLFKNEQNTA